MTRRDRDITTMSLLLDTLATGYPNAVEQLLTHLLRIDGHTGGPGSERVSGAGSDLTTVEAAADRRLALTTTLDALRRQRDLTIVAIGELSRQIDRAARWTTDAPAAPPALCRDGQHGRDGVLEWGDPLCMRTADKAGLCHAHYMASRRWREANGIDTSRDYQPAAV